MGKMIRTGVESVGFLLLKGFVMKTLLKVLAVLVVLLVVGVVVVVLLLNGIVKSAVQSAGTSATGATTTLGGVDLSLLGGTATIQDFVLANPEGFTAGPLFSLGSAEVQIKSGSLLSGTVVVPRVHIDGAHLTVVFENGKLNLSELRKEIAKRAGEAAADTASETAGKNIVIEDLRITNTKVTGSIALFPGSEPIAVKLTIADIAKQNIGSDGSGLKLDDVVGLILETVALNATEEIAKGVPGLGDLEDMLGDVEKQASEAIDKGSEQVDRAIEDAGEKVNKALGDLLGGKKE